MTESVSRRNVLKWTGALAAAGVVGIGLGFGGDLLLRPNTTKTVTQNNTVTNTATHTATQTVTQTATSTVTQPPTTLTQTSTTTSLQQEQLLTSAWDAGPFMAHVVNGVWTKSSPLQPNIPGSMTLFGARNRVNNPDRILYPLQRVDFSTTNRNTQNRGKSQYVRITWDQAFTLIASELSRVKTTYGPSAFLMSGTGHAWPMTVNSGAKWQANLFGLLGGATTMVGDTSQTGAYPAGNVTFGTTALGTTATNNEYDVLANSKLVIVYGCDPAWKNYNTTRQNISFRQWKAAGIKVIVVDAFVHNDTAALYADQFISPLPGTDEAFLAAVANVWINNNTYNTAYVQKYVYGFQQFHDYIMGVSDGTPKTPAWASAICGVDATTITNFASEWASVPTFVYGTYPEGAQRRSFAGQHTRMQFALCAMQGLGLPGRGFGGTFSVATTVTATGMGSMGSIPSVTNPVTQIIRHGALGDALNKGTATWTTCSRHSGVCGQETYPLSGSSQIHLIAWGSGSGSSAGLNQRMDINPKIQGVQTTGIEFTFSCNAWWESTAKFSDVICPVATVGEVEDMTTWLNYVVYQHQLQQPLGEAMSDMAIYTGIAAQLGLDQQLTNGKTAAQWLEQVYPAASIPMSFQQFQQVGFYEYPLNTTPAVTATWANFYANPTANPLPTKSGLIEIYSQAMASFFGTTNPNAPPIPMYIPGPENLLNATSTYPLLLSSAHAKFARHSQWQNLAWIRDEPQMYTSGYKTMLMNPADATTYGVKTGDVVQVSNARGSLLAGVFVSAEQAPKTVWISEGGWYTPQQPGVVGSTDLGGNVNVLIDHAQPEPMCDGLLNSALVQITKFTGTTGTGPATS